MKEIFNEEETQFLIDDLEVNEDEYNQITNQDIRSKIKNYDMYTKAQNDYFERLIEIIKKNYQPGDEVPISFINSLVKEEELEPLIRSFQTSLFKNRKQVMIELINQLKFMEKIKINDEKGRRL